MSQRRVKDPNLDFMLLGLVQENWDISIPWFLCTSYLYYEKNESVVSDETFDWLCHEMLERFSSLRHRHKKYVSKEMLEAGTGHTINWDKMPSMIKGGAMDMLKEYYKLKRTKK